MAYYCAHIDLTHKDAWDDLTKSHPASGFHQSFAWTAFKQADGWQSYKIGLFDVDTDELCGGAVVLEFGFLDGTNFLYIPEGPLLRYDNEDQLFWQWRCLETAIHSMVSLGSNEKTTHIRLEPRIEQVPEWFFGGFAKSPVNLQPRHTQLLHIGESDADILSKMKPKGRYNIHLALRKGVTVRSVALTDIHLFFSVYKETFERNKFDGKDLAFFERLVTHTAEMTQCFVAEVDGRVLASALVVYWGDRATYLYGASRATDRAYMAPYALHWHIIQTAKQRGCQVYDWWGVAPDDTDETHEWHGLTRFKKQYGGEQKDWVGAYDYIIQPDLYEQFVKTHET